MPPAKKKKKQRHMPLILSNVAGIYGPVEIEQ